ncbi:MarR family winged helix-turn-helix transcriptional regulator [Streptomyces sp. x-19]|uniref:MarR family winged helix-turn-helix transcriptional regulator n=1 Tax=Streptomyces sp. x-19 TaxID=2789280 RepID=UPI003980005E
MNTPVDEDPSTSLALDFGLALRRAQHLLAQRIDEVLRPLDLNLGLWRVLHEAERHPGASAAELARASFHTPQTLSGLLRRLEDRGLVERTTGRGRIVENHLTTMGHDVLTTATQHVEEIVTATLTGFSPAERAHLRQLLTEYTDALTRDQHDSPH